MPDLGQHKHPQPGLDDDLVQPFQLEGQAIRGRLVRLGPLVDDIVSRHAYPEPVAVLLAQALALAATLAGVFKYDGVFTLQTKGDGPIGLLVADVTSTGEVRGYARYDEARLAAAEREASAGQGPHAVVPRLPLTGGEEGASLDEAKRELREDAWRRALVLMGSATTGELLDPALDAHGLLYRLFHEDGVRVFRRRPLKPGCRCSYERVVTVLRALSPTELEEMKVEGRITVVCQFCMREYAFDDAELRAALAPGP